MADVAAIPLPAMMTAAGEINGLKNLPMNRPVNRLITTTTNIHLML